ncbi:MAG: dCTP deaminase [Candidatus Wallbacteria bacterium]|nr:dCTP deaminase [Candidatus Wallbacteria bacterium]
MILSDRDIEQALDTGRIKITPAPDLATQLGSCSIDLKLGDVFRVFEHSKVPFIDLKPGAATEGFMREIVVKEGEPFVMQPGEFVLAATVETLELPDDLVGRLEGRSSLGRLGIIVHGTASVFDPGWVGRVTMELGNLGRMPIALYPGMRVCSFTFETLTSPSRVPYRQKPGNKYSGQQGPLASRIDRELTRG